MVTSPTWRNKMGTGAISGDALRYRATPHWFLCTVLPASIAPWYRAQYKGSFKWAYTPCVTWGEAARCAIHDWLSWREIYINRCFYAIARGHLASPANGSQSHLAARAREIGNYSTNTCSNSWRQPVRADGQKASQRSIITCTFLQWSG